MALPIAPSSYQDHAAKRRDPDRLSERAKRDDALKPDIQRILDGNFAVYGVRKVWRQMQREGIGVARGTVARLMRAIGLEGIICGKPLRTTVVPEIEVSAKRPKHSRQKSSAMARIRKRRPSEKASHNKSMLQRWFSASGTESGALVASARLRAPMAVDLKPFLPVEAPKPFVMKGNPLLKVDRRS